MVAARVTSSSILYQNYLEDMRYQMSQKLKISQDGDWIHRKHCLCWLLSKCTIKRTLKKLNDDSLKSWITEYDIIYERKNINTRQGKFYGNLMFFSNHAITMDFKDMKQRILVIEADYKIAENLKYFGQWRKPNDEPDFLPTMFTYFASHVDISNFQQQKPH